jgi:hypothetical protein
MATPQQIMVGQQQPLMGQAMPVQPGMAMPVQGQPMMGQPVMGQVRALISVQRPRAEICPPACPPPAAHSRSDAARPSARPRVVCSP